MEFRIADTFTDSLARLSSEEQKAVKTTAFDLQLNPSHPSLQFHKLAKAKDPNFWSIRVSRDVRLIVHKTGTSLFSTLSDDQLLAFGVPREWLGDARSANEDSVLDLAGHLPAEAAEALLNLATGGVQR